MFIAVATLFSSRSFLFSAAPAARIDEAPRVVLRPSLSDARLDLFNQASGKNAVVFDVLVRNFKDVSDDQLKLVEPYLRGLNLKQPWDEIIAFIISVSEHLKAGVFPVVANDFDSDDEDSKSSVEAQLDSDDEESEEDESVATAPTSFNP
jgi:hypothetical protein